MTDEPRYVDDPFEEEDHWWKTDELIHQEILRQAFSACRRTFRFKSKSERTKWTRIDKQLADNKIPFAWIENCITWAEKKNRPLYPRVAIQLESLANFILNKSRMEDWLGKNPDIAQEWLDDWDSDEMEF